MTDVNDAWIESASKYIVDFECDCDCFRCMQDIHECDCDPEYFGGNNPSGEFYGHVVDYDLARDMERGK